MDDMWLSLLTANRLKCRQFWLKEGPSIFFSLYFGYCPNSDSCIIFYNIVIYIYIYVYVSRSQYVTPSLPTLSRNIKYSAATNWFDTRWDPYCQKSGININYSKPYSSSVRFLVNQLGSVDLTNSNPNILANTNSPDHCF